MHTQMIGANQLNVRVVGRALSDLKVQLLIAILNGKLTLMDLEFVKQLIANNL